MKYNNKKIGDLGENIAIDYLYSIGYSIIEKNFRCKIGEIDIISQNKNTICFIEVKTRHSKNYGEPCEAVNYFKRIKIYRTAYIYIQKNKLHKYNIRFDIIEIMINSNKRNYNIKLIKNAFQV
ncbi:YraN family protein [Clostridium tyrobutyricum]|uniref:YraN family protein n=1 Tax=Clostridium tyrobutyricum TaxID=1519 RepID=UPI001C385BBB|nr:YraN family protein [Clostridium tyrobutyricum]MBV4418066.1 YraN family protein [Clostridium tyrobutyricum]